MRTLRARRKRANITTTVPGAGAATTLRVGLSGSMGAGKSTVAAALARRGAAIIDADALARRASDDPAVLARIAAEVGRELVVAGRLDRPATAALVFADASARQRLEAIIHPWVRHHATALERALLERELPPVMIVHDVPLLFERELERDLDVSVAVLAPLSLREARVAARGGDPSGVRARDSAQLPSAVKAARADFVIENDGDEAELERAVAALWTSLRMLP